MRSAWVVWTALLLAAVFVSRGASDPVHGDPAPPDECERVVDMRHLVLTMEIDFEAERIRARARWTLSLLVPSSSVQLDAVGFVVEHVAVGVDRREMNFEQDEKALRILLGETLPAGRELRIEIDYVIHRPKKGIHFVNPDGSQKDVPRQVWTQSEPDETRGWIPCVDSPLDKSTVETIVTVPLGMLVVSNGRLVERRAKTGGRVETFHHRQKMPHAIYLTTVVAGDFVRLGGPEGRVPLEYFVASDEAIHAPRSFRKTSDILYWLERETGVSYPFEKYAQVTVRRFMWGGMENSGATTLTASTIHDERSHITWNSDGLVAHELAHQWFGNLVTARSWAHIWLNEGFATYYTQLWKREDEGEDAFRLSRNGSRQGYFRHAKGSIRPVIFAKYDSSYEVFDAHAYSKGGAVLHMLRQVVGDEVFRRAVKRYLMENRARSVTTRRLQIAFEKEWKGALDWFFDQWLRRPGHPVIVVDWNWEPDVEQMVLSVKQVQSTEKGVPAIFRFPLTWKAVGSQGVFRGRIEVTQREQVFRIPLPGLPDFVRLDEGGNLLGEIRHPKGVEELTAQLAHDDDVIGRLRAATDLGKHVKTQRVASALAVVLVAERAPEVRRRALNILAKRKDALALHLALLALRDSDATVRVDACRVLGKFSDELTSERLVERIGSDPSYGVVHAALNSLARLGDERTFELATQLMKLKSFRGRLAGGALRSLGRLGDSRAIQIALARMDPGWVVGIRQAAIDVVGQLGGGNELVRDRLHLLLRDSDHRIRRSVAEALGKIGTTEDVKRLRRYGREEPIYRSRSAYEAAAKRIEKRYAKKIKPTTTGARSLSAIREERLKVQEERLKMQERVEELQEREQKLRAREQELAPAPESGPQRRKKASGNK